LNASESETIEGIAAGVGLRGFTIVNTCAVTAEAERKLRQTIRKLYGEDKHVKIILTGCAAQLHVDSYLQMDGVVGIIPNDKKSSPDEYRKYLCWNSSVAEGEDISAAENFCDIQAATVQQRPQKVRGFLQIQNGCDQHCTYCIVRITRGNNVSYGMDDILQLAKNMIRKGYVEIVLTGVNITSYGRDSNSGSGLAFLIRHLLKNIPELKRLRLSSLDPADMNQDLIDVIVGEDRFMPHIHESVQSGDNIILQRMMRRHLREKVIETNQKILSARPEIIFGADFIVGFPTETDEMFANTVSLLVEASLVLTHIFPFSARPGTAAALMPQVNGATISARARQLRSQSKALLNQKLSEFIGSNVRILAETTTDAKTDSFLKVKSTNPLVAGQICDFKCLAVDKGTLLG
jgi:threonylcarbamoyladenosine tRNA methylthiotransferase MtaB